MKTKLLIIFLLGVLFLDCERFRHLPPEERFNKIVEYLNDELNLTKDQYQQLQSIKVSILQRYKSIETNLFWFDQNFLNDFEKGNFNKEEVKKNIKNLHNKMLENRLQDVEDVYPFVQTLSYDQRKKLVELINKYKSHFKRHLPN
ncbi:MAG: hypothetical protein ACK4UJ_05130 [Leptonema sp. (in: bacteria)]